MERMYWRLALGSLLLGALLNCATVDPTCQQEINACLERCEKSGGNEVDVEHATPEVSTTWCEGRCQNCRESTTTPPSPPSASPPTYTGNAQP